MKGSPSGFRLFDASFIRFLIVGVANTMTGLLVIYAAKWFFGANDVLANVIGYGLGLIQSFILNSTWTFKHRGKVLPALAKFLLTFLCAYALNLATVMAAIHLFSVNSYVAQAMGILPYTLFFYLASRYFVFMPDKGAA